MFSPGMSFSFASICKDLVQGSALYVSDTVKEAASKTASYMYEAAKKRCPETVDKVEKFSQSVIGKKVVSSVTSTVGESVGIALGSAYPTQMVAFSVGQKIADQMVPNSKDEALAQRKTRIVWSAGVGAVLTVTALSVSISYLLSDPTSGTITYGTMAYGFLMTSLGTIVGGVEGLQLVGVKRATPENVLDSYPVRTFQYLAAQGAAEAIRSVIPVPQSLLPLTGIVGGAFKTIVGAAGYHAKPLTQLAIQRYWGEEPSSLTVNYFDPGEAFKAMIENSHGHTGYYKYEMAQQYVSFIPFAAQFVEQKLGRVIDQKVGTNVLVRTFNEYTLMIQHPKIAAATKALMNCPEKDSDQRALLQKKLDECLHEQIATQFGIAEKLIAYTFESNATLPIHKYVGWVVDQIQAKEIQMIGFELSDHQKNRTMLEVHAVNYLTLAFIQLKRALPDAVQVEDLTDQELKVFYGNLNSLVFTPYTNSFIGQVAQHTVGAALPFMLDHGQGVADRVLNPNNYVPIIEEISDDEFPTEMMDGRRLASSTISPLVRRFPFLAKVQQFFSSVWNDILSLLGQQRPAKVQNWMTSQSEVSPSEEIGLKVLKSKGEKRGRVS